MSAFNVNAGEPMYYDPAEVKAYVNDVTTTIKALQCRLADAAQRADVAERALAECQPETASVGRALILASEVADKTISDADAHAAEAIRAAELQAGSILALARAEAAQSVDSARAEADRLAESARRAAADVFREGEARLLSAVNAFIDGSNLLRQELARIGDEATDWRSIDAAHEDSSPPPPSAEDTAGEIAEADFPIKVSPIIKVSPFLPPGAPLVANGNRRFDDFS